MPRTPNTDVTRNALATLVQADGPMTREALGLSHHYVRRLVADGDIVQATDKNGTPLVQKVTHPETGEALRGHPHNLFKATKKGRAKGRRVLAKSDAPVAVEA